MTISRPTAQPQRWTSMSYLPKRQAAWAITPALAGWPGRYPRTRELVVHQNYILVYDVAGDVAKRSRPNTAERVKRAHEAAAHEAWFRAEVEQAITEAEDPNTQWGSHEAVMAKLSKRRANYAKALKDGEA